MALRFFIGPQDHWRDASRFDERRQVSLGVLCGRWTRWEEEVGNGSIGQARTTARTQYGCGSRPRACSVMLANRTARRDHELSCITGERADRVASRGRELSLGDRRANAENGCRATSSHQVGRGLLSINNSRPRPQLGHCRSLGLCDASTTAGFVPAAGHGSSGDP